MYQVEWICDTCNETHFGNCPKVTGTLTTSTPNTQPSTPEADLLQTAGEEVEKAFSTPEQDKVWGETTWPVNSTPEEDTLREVELLTDPQPVKYVTLGLLKSKLEAQRQSDLKKLSFHLGVDVKTLEGYLQSKERV